MKGSVTHMGDVLIESDVTVSDPINADSIISTIDAETSLTFTSLNFTLKVYLPPPVIFCSNLREIGLSSIRFRV